MLDRKITPNMIAQAEILLARSAHWSRGTAVTTDGLTVGVVYFSSSRRRKDGSPIVHMVRCDGAVCSCESFSYRQACAHAVACRMDTDRAREAAARKPVSKYALLAGCSARNCDNDRESGDSRYCPDHQLVEAF